MLRAARHSGRNWITVDIDPADRHLIPPSRVQAADHRDQLVPADATWVEATVTSTAVAGNSYPALVPDGYATDAGFAVPRFDRHTVERMIADLDAVQATDVMPGEHPHLILRPSWGSTGVTGSGPTGSSQERHREKMPAAQGWGQNQLPDGGVGPKEVGARVPEQVAKNTHTCGSPATS